MSGNSKRRNRRLSNDAQWCLDNQTTLSLKSFAEHFGLLDRQYTNARYRTIITKYFSHSAQLLTEYNSWNNSEKCKLFWTARKRKKNRLDAEAAVVDYLGDVISREASHLNQTNIPHTCHNDTIQTEEREEEASNSAVTVNEDHSTSFNEDENLSRFERSQEKNIYTLFNEYKEKAMQMSANSLLQIETHLHELLSHTNILLLTPDQHSETLLEVFSEATLNSLHSSLINKFDDRFEKIDIDQEAQILSHVSRIITAVEKKELDRSEAELQLLTLARGKEYCLTRTIKAINNLLQKLPINAIKDVTCISESELFTIYVDPILSSLVSDPERNTLLRWSNKRPEENDFRPDATITKLKQMKYHHNLGHGEIKVNNSSNHALALDLLRINILAKDTLDFNKLSNAFGFQVIGFTAVFYLMSLEFRGTYTMTEIGRIKLPKSINELAAFLSQKNFHLLLYVCQVFWSNCSIAPDQKVITERFQPTLNNIYRLIDVSKNKYRECSLYFEA